jgi:hypothetical protein
VVPDLTTKGKRKFLKERKHLINTSDWDHQSVSVVITQMVEYLNEWIDSKRFSFFFFFSFNSTKRKIAIKKEKLIPLLLSLPV